MLSIHPVSVLDNLNLQERVASRLLQRTEKAFGSMKESQYPKPILE